MKPTKSILQFFTNYIFNNIKNNLDTLFSTNEFKLNQKKTILSIPYDTFIYEKPDIIDTNVIIASNYKNLGDDEYFVYTIEDILKNLDINTKLRESKADLYNLIFVFQKNIITYDILYDPDITIPSIMESFKMYNLPDDIMEEYIIVGHRFSHMSFHNHTTTMTLHEIPKLTLSISGKLFNKPDIEYYVVFGEGYKRYTVQVYKLLPSGKRSEMLFGVWIDSNTKHVYEPYIIKLLPKPTPEINKLD